MYKGRAVLGLGRAFVGAPTAALLLALAGRVARNGGALEYFKARPAAPPELPPGGPDFTAPEGAPLKTQQVGPVVRVGSVSVEVAAAVVLRAQS